MLSAHNRTRRLCLTPISYYVCLGHFQGMVSQIHVPVNNRKRGFYQTSARLVLAGGALRPYYICLLVLCTTSARWCSSHDRPPALASGLPRCCIPVIVLGSSLACRSRLGLSQSRLSSAVRQPSNTLPPAGRNGVRCAGRVPDAARGRGGGIGVPFLDESLGIRV